MLFLLMLFMFITLGYCVLSRFNHSQCSWYQLNDWHDTHSILVQYTMPEHVGCAHREAADPRQLLRSINAAEAALVEPAAGLHIRFRLGGSSFPPILLYKLFTHRPVTGELSTNPVAGCSAASHSSSSVWPQPCKPRGAASLAGFT